MYFTKFPNSRLADARIHDFDLTNSRNLCITKLSRFRIRIFFVQDELASLPNSLLENLNSSQFPAHPHRSLVPRGFHFHRSPTFSRNSISNQLRPASQRGSHGLPACSRVTPCRPGHPAQPAYQSQVPPSPRCIRWTVPRASPSREHALSGSRIAPGPTCAPRSA